MTLDIKGGKKMSSIQHTRSNTWTFCIYPGDSLPENYMQIISNWHIPVLISPIHRADKNGDDTEKKKHIHVMMYFGVGANKSIDQVRKFSDQLNACRPQIVHSTNALIRYFVHKDNPEKAQYDIDEIIAFSGFEWRQAFENFTTDQEFYYHIEEIIKSNVISNLVDLQIYMLEHNDVFAYSFVRSHVAYFQRFLDGIYQKIRRSK